MRKLIKLSLSLMIVVNVFGLTILSAQASLVPNPTASTVPAGCPQGSKNCGNYNLNDMLGVVRIVAEFILGIVGSLALLAFVAGGLMWILSGGRSELVEKGKQTIIGAVIGLIIVFTSYMIIQLVFSALGIKAAADGGWSISSWFK